MKWTLQLSYLDASEAAHGLEGRQGDRHFGLVIGIAIGLWVLSMQSSGNILVRVGL